MVCKISSLIYCQVSLLNPLLYANQPLIEVHNKIPNPSTQLLPHAIFTLYEVHVPEIFTKMQFPVAVRIASSHSSLLT